MMEPLTELVIGSVFGLILIWFFIEFMWLESFKLDWGKNDK